ncbi:hypothetical protein PV703_02520 [Streptomyces sp. ME01-24h]|nr:hypothetical protein [Streptomyces sp. ME19-03-3]MDX3352213.1 hypothetical protein [Streptomyces sp. ME01-24h]
MRSDTESSELSLELLVHGVGGTTPQAMLKDSRITRVCGDDTAGIYRRADDTDAEHRPRREGESPVADAYSWCNLTSGDGSRALWLLLLPFMVANLAHWMRPPVSRPGMNRAYDVLVRLLALSLTALLVAAACEVAMDLVAWQCAGNAACAGGRSGLSLPAVGEPGRRIAVGAVLPAGLTVLLWWLSRRTWYAYESQWPLPGAPPRARAGADVTPLARRGFWYGRRLVARLRAAHTAAGLLTVAVALVVPPLARDMAVGEFRVLASLGWSLTGVLSGLTAAVVAVTCGVGRSEHAPDEALDPRLARALLGGTAAAVLAAAVYACWHRPGWTADGRLPAGDAFGWLTLIQGLLLAALAAVAHLMHRFGGGRAQLRGLGGPAVALLACCLGGVLTGGITQRVADWLDRGAPPGSGISPAAGPPVLLSWQASAIPVLLLVLAVVVTVRGRRLLRRTRALVPEVESDYPGEEHQPARSRQIALARARAELTDQAALFLAVVAVVAFLLGAGALGAAWLSGAVPGRVGAGAPGWVRTVAQTAQDLGSWLAGAGVVALFTLGRRAYRDAGARRTVGILWDVGTFWPRAAHPFAPPCYAERAVPDLTWRMTTWTRAHRGKIIVSGHSQGSVLAAAAVWQLDPTTRARIALLTYGSPLGRLYGRWFPAYFGPPALTALHGEVHAWRNLWRRTDPIGGPVHLDGPGPPVDRAPLPDPAVYGRTQEHPLPAPLLTHFDYRADPAFAAERRALLGWLYRGTEGVLPGQGQGSGGRSSG